MKLTKTQLKKVISETVKEELKRKVRKPLQENTKLLGMASPSPMQNPFGNGTKSNAGDGANSRLNEMLLRNKLDEAQEYMEYVQELLSDASKLAPVEEHRTKGNSTKKVTESLEEQIKKVRKTINRLLGRS